MPGNYNFTIFQGANLNRKLTWKSAGSPVDLTGYSARLQARENKLDDAIVLDMTTANGKIVLGSGGEITLKLTEAQSRSLSFDQAFYDLEMVSPSGEVTRLLEGKVFLSREVTR